MTTNENIMSEMLERATNPETADDELAIQMFVLVVQKDLQMITKAQEIIMSKIRSTNVAESIKAVALLEECMAKCGTEFQDDIAKFRFLNELIRLVSKKYQGDSTPTPIKQRIMECLLLWTTEFPQKGKIREAYDMLNKEGAVEHGNSTASVAKRESVLGIDEDTLSKLIKSGNPENFKRANLLIQNRVNQESRRINSVLQQKSELQEAQSTVDLLDSMLTAYEAEGCVQIEDNETVNLMRELYHSTKKHKPILQRLPELIGDTDESLLSDALQTNDALIKVMKRYKDIVVHAPSKVVVKNKSQTDLLSELLGVKEDENIAKEPIATNAKNTINSPKSDTKMLSNLDEIFGNFENNKNETITNDFLGNINILKPVNVFPPAESECEVNNVSSIPSTRRAFRELRDIDKLSDELFKQNMQTVERLGSFHKKEQEKITLNDLVKEKKNISQTNSTTTTPTKSVIIQEKTISSQTHKTSLNFDDDEILGSKDTEKMHNHEEVEVDKEIGEIKNKHDMRPKPLSEIEIDLDQLTACDSQRILLDDEDVTVTLNFTEDRPSKNVSVFVIAVSNKSKYPLKDFNFEASVKKPCKVRLLPPTDTALAPYRPYRPPTPINQVLLLLNPSGKDVDITCIFGYKLGDDPDPIKESIIAKNIPFVV